MTTVELLQIVLVPLAVVLIPVVWGTFGAVQRRRQFGGLVFREVVQFHPSTKTLDDMKLELQHAPTWNEFTAPHILLHRQILGAPTENRDFILNLSPKLIYSLNQLWDAWDRGDWRAWLHNLCELEGLAPRARRTELANLRHEWCKVLADHFVRESSAELTMLCNAKPAKHERHAVWWTGLVPIGLLVAIAAWLVAFDSDGPRFTAQAVQAAVLRHDANPTATAMCAPRAYPRDSWLCRVSYLDRRGQMAVGVTVRRGRVVDVESLGPVRWRPR